MPNRDTWFIFIGIIGLVPLTAGAQDRIPDILARAGESVHATAPAGSGYVGPDRSIQVLLEMTDVIVRGRLENPRSVLSDDQREVHTEYTIATPQYVYMPRVSKPDLTPPASVRIKGGAMTINGLTYTATYEALPLPQPGPEYLLLLRESGNRYYLAGQYYGIFRITDGRLEPLAKNEKYVAEFRDIPASKGIAEIVARRTRLGQ